MDKTRNAGGGGGKSSNLFQAKQGDDQDIKRYITDSSIFNV